MITLPSQMVADWQHRFTPTVDHARLIEEEYKEWVIENLYNCGGSKDNQAELKELCDLLFVIYGYALQKRWDIDKAFTKVYLSNMSKTLKQDGSGKTMKGDKYIAPDLKDCI